MDGGRRQPLFGYTSRILATGPYQPPILLLIFFHPHEPAQTLTWTLDRLASLAPPDRILTGCVVEIIDAARPRVRRSVRLGNLPPGTSHVSLWSVRFSHAFFYGECHEYPTFIRFTSPHPARLIPYVRLGLVDRHVSGTQPPGPGSGRIDPIKGQRPLPEPGCQESLPQPQPRSPLRCTA